jgi:hypothetical protein
MRKLIGLILMFVSFAAYGQHGKGTPHKKVKAYNDADYPADQYSTRTDTASLGVVKLQTIHVMSTGLREETECKAWLYVKKGNKNTAQFFFDEIMGDYGAAGVFFPKKQPREDMFIAMKFGDYDGRIIVIDRDGNANNMPGGDFYMSEDNKYLFSNYNSDQTGVTIIDMDKNNVIYADSAEDQSKLGQWYFQDDKFFAIAQPTAKDEEDTTKLSIATLDLKKKKLIFSRVEKDYPEKDSKLKFYSFYDKPEDKGNCSCGKR